MPHLPATPACQHCWLQAPGPLPDLHAHAQSTRRQRPGDNYFSEFGNPAFGRNESDTPVLVAGGHAFTAITVGNSFACGLLANQSLMCWGRCGAGVACYKRLPPLGRDERVGTAADRCRCHCRWGTPQGRSVAPSLLTPYSNDAGQLGTSNREAAAEPTLAMAPRRFTATSAGFDFVCGIEADTRDAFCWGYALFLAPATLTGFLLCVARSPHTNAAPLCMPGLANSANAATATQPI